MGLRPISRTSTPAYADPATGQHCGSCYWCEYDDYNPSGLGVCEKRRKIVNVRRPTTCEVYRPISDIRLEEKTDDN